jgi:hypothetical protein
VAVHGRIVAQICANRNDRAPQRPLLHRFFRFQQFDMTRLLASIITFVVLMLALSCPTKAGHPVAADAGA